MAKLIKTEIQRPGTFEGLASGFGSLFIVIGFAFLLICFVASGNETKVSQYDKFGENGYDVTLIIFGISGLLFSIGFYITFRSFGEIIRLLKKLNNMPFGGKISMGQPVYSFMCPECKSRNAESDKECRKCGVKFEASN